MAGRFVSKAFIGIEFEIIGKVTGVYFKPRAKEKADELGVVGWISYSDNGSVVGEAQGDREGMIAMMDWLKMKGSPTCIIKKAVIKENWYLPHLRFLEFAIVEKPLHIPNPHDRGAMKQIHPLREVQDTIESLQEPPQEEDLSELTEEELLDRAEAKATGPPPDPSRVPTTYIVPRKTSASVVCEDGNGVGGTAKEVRV